MFMSEIEKKYYSIGEVAEMFEVAPSVIRFWEGQFPHLKPRKNKNGTRQYTLQDIEQIKTIYHLVKEKGYTLQGAKETLKNKPLVKDHLAAIESLKRVKSFLIDLKNTLKDE
jgi:DNA-binding transcriptional MerR regulator